MPEWEDVTLSDWIDAENPLGHGPGVLTPEEFANGLSAELTSATILFVHVYGKQVGDLIRALGWDPPQYYRRLRRSTPKMWSIRYINDLANALSVSPANLLFKIQVRRLLDLPNEPG